MSISSMTNVAYKRREDVGGGAPDTLQEVAQAKGEEPNPQNAIASALSAITAYIPTEILALYVAVVAVNQSLIDGQRQHFFSELVLFVIFLILTPIIVWLIYAGKVVSANDTAPLRPKRWPKWEMFAATAAYAAWAFAIPANQFDVYSWYSPAIAGVAVLAVSILLGLLAPLFNGPTSP